MSTHRWEAAYLDTTDWRLDSELDAVRRVESAVTFAKSNTQCPDLTFIPMGYFDVLNDPDTFIGDGQLPSQVSQWTATTLDWSYGEFNSNLEIHLDLRGNFAILMPNENTQHQFVLENGWDQFKYEIKAVHCKYQDFSTAYDLNFQITNVYGEIDLGDLDNFIQPVLDTRVPSG